MVTTSLVATHQKGDAVLQWLRRWRERDDRHLARPRSLEHVDPLEELIRVVNEAQDVTPETNVVFMIPTSASGRSLSSEGGLNNPLRRIRGAAIYQHLCRLIVRKRPLV
jgi:hypothetical protein